MYATISLLLVLAAVDIPFVLNSRQGVPVVEVRINGRLARFILDTGSTNTLVADELTTGSAPGKSVIREDRNGLEVHARWWEVDLEVAGRRWPRRMVGIVDLSRVREHYGKDIAGLLGQDVLKEFDAVRIDYRKKMLTLE